jgi:hypothetical protein
MPGDIQPRTAPVTVKRSPAPSACAESAGVNLNLELLNSRVDHPGYQCDHTANERRIVASLEGESRSDQHVWLSIKLIRPRGVDRLQDNGRPHFAQQDVVVLVGAESEFLNWEMGCRRTLGVELSDHVAGFRFVLWIIPLDVDDVGFGRRVDLVRPDQLAGPHGRPAFLVAAQRLDQLVKVIAEETGLVEWVRQGCSGLRELDRGSRR